ncbi:fimbrial protein [Escherichia coli]|nr:fimbrial protein [Escherichia coli]
MKKTLIALAVVASAAMSGSAMAVAWEKGTINKAFELSGTLTTADVETPWEIKSGTAAANLDADIPKGQSAASIGVTSGIHVLSIRVADAESKSFQGKQGIAPSVDYHGAVKVSEFSKGVAPLTLDVKNEQEEKIGTLTTSFSAAGEGSFFNTSTNSGGKHQLLQTAPGQLFAGGLGTSSGAINTVAWRLALDLDEDVVSNYNDFGIKTALSARSMTPTDSSLQYSAFYVAGIEQGKTINISLNKAAEVGNTIWRASLPVTVSYQ